MRNVIQYRGEKKKGPLGYEGGIIYDRLVPARKREIEIREEFRVKKVGRVVTDTGGCGRITEVSRDIIVMKLLVNIGHNHAVKTGGVVAVVVTI